MYKKIFPKQSKIPLMRFPHCDAGILHAPGECTYCDAHPDWQQLRIIWGIAFTGYIPEAKELPCPADYRRPNGQCEDWFGNKPLFHVIPGSGDMPLFNVNLGSGISPLFNSSLNQREINMKVKGK